MHANLQKQLSVIWEELHPAQIIVQPISGFLIWSFLEGGWGGGYRCCFTTKKMYYRYKKEVQSLKYFCHSVNLKVHWKVTEKVPEIRMSVNIHWVFLGLKRESPSCARLRKGANYVCVFAWLCIVFKLTSNWYLNSGDLSILVTSFLLWKTKILYLLSGLFRLSNLKLHMNDSKTV